jgi:putative transcriptional regulator
MLYMCNNIFMRVTGNKTPTITIHNRLAVLRAERNLSRQELADAVGINFQTIGYLERGDYNPSLELAFKLSEFFDLPIEAIFSRTPFTPLSTTVYRKESA